MSNTAPLTSRAARRAAAFVLAAVLAAPAVAQWAWRDETGRLVFSDRPPPANIKAENIVRQPGGANRSFSAVAAPVPAEEENAPGKAEGKQPTGPKTLAEREMESRKRQQERAEAEKKQAEEQANLAAKRENCERTRGYLRALEDGVRIRRTDAQGNAEFLDDAQRAAEIQKARDNIARACN